MNYEDLLKEADEEGLIVREKNLPGYDGRIYLNRIAIRKETDTKPESLRACGRVGTSLHDCWQYSGSV